MTPIFKDYLRERYKEEQLRDNNHTWDDADEAAFDTDKLSQDYIQWAEDYAMKRAVDFAQKTNSFVPQKSDESDYYYWKYDQLYPQK